MHAIAVRYTVAPSFVSTNEANILDVMAELAALGDTGVRYTAFKMADGCSFLHLVVMDDPAKAGVIPGLASFTRFRAALKDGARTPPTNEEWTVVGTSVPLQAVAEAVGG